MNAQPALLLLEEDSVAYLLAADYPAFGLCADTADAWVTSASAMIEAHCRRPTLMSASYTERLRFGRGPQVVRLSYAPLVSVDSMKARYECRREAEGNCGFVQEVATTFGLPGAWIEVDVTTLDVCLPLGELRLTESVFAPRFSEAEVTYTAGVASVPDAVKVACAQIVRNAQATPALNVKTNKMSGLEMDYFSDSLLDAQVRALLRPYVAERVA